MSARKSVLPGNPATAIANDGTTVLRRYRVDGVIYARNVREARSRLREMTYSGALDDAIVVPPRSSRR